MRVLIVDDEPLVRRALARAFRVEGHEVKELASGEEAIVEWPLFGPDIVLLDVIMPGLSGPQVLEEIGQDDSKVVLMSAYSGDQEILTGEGARALMFLKKPFSNIFEVVKTIEGLV